MLCKLGTKLSHHNTWKVGMPMLASPKQPSSRSKLQPGFFHSNCVHPEVCFIIADLTCWAQALISLLRARNRPVSQLRFPNNHHRSRPLRTPFPITMISDNYLFILAVFLGSCAMLLIVLYHFLEVNAQDDDESSTSSGKAKVSVSSPDSKTSKTPGADPVATTSSGGSRPSS